MNNNAFNMVTIGLLSLVCVTAHADDSSLTGSYTVTRNVSTIDTPLTSVNNLVTLNYKPSWGVGNFDYRAESYTEPSFHSLNGSIVNEHKLEMQLNYNYPITNIFGATGGILYHTNYTFQDTYYWGVAGLTFNQSISSNTTIAATFLAEKRSSGGRVFYDASASAEYLFRHFFSAFVALHRYENLGEYDINPTQKLEYEIGLNYNLSRRFFTGISYLHHSQYNDPADRFALLKVKLGVNF